MKEESYKEVAYFQILNPNGEVHGKHLTCNREDTANHIKNWLSYCYGASFSIKKCFKRIRVY